MEDIESCVQTNWIERIKPAYSEQLPNFIAEDGSLVCGIYTGMDNETYHSIDAVNASLIKTMISKTPAHVRKELNRRAPGNEKHHTNRALELGTLAHELILEPTKFDEQYFKLVDINEHPDALVTVKDLSDYCDKYDLPKSAGCKQELIERVSQHDHTVAIWDLIVARSLTKGAGSKAFDIAQQLVNDKKAKNIIRAFDTKVVKRYCVKRPIDAELWADVFKIKKAFEEHSRAPLLVRDGFAEIVMIAHDPITDLTLKIKIDYLRKDSIALDVKTARSADPSKFSKQSKDLRYDVQAEFYKYVASILQVPLEMFAFVAIEYDEAEICEIFELSERRQAQGWEDTKIALRAFKECLDTDNWYGYTANDQVIVID